jgi:hypothetical protein
LVDAQSAESPDAVAQHLEPYRRAGPEDALCLFASEDPDDLLGRMRIVAERVAPRSADAGSARPAPAANATTLDVPPRPAGLAPLAGDGLGAVGGTSCKALLTG